MIELAGGVSGGVVSSCGIMPLAAALHAKRPLPTNDIAGLDIGHLDQVGEHVTALGFSHRAQLAQHALDIIELVRAPFVV